MTLSVGSLFAGIGGIDLGLERAGMKVRWQVEIDPWCQKVLAKHWPGVERFADVRDVGADLVGVDVLAGGFPCQPVSNAGSRRAQADARWLWPEFFRLVRLLRPRYVFVENVAGLLHRGVGDVLGDLAAIGYDAEWESLPAASVGAPHIRDRVFIVAYPNGVRRVHGETRGLAASSGESAFCDAGAGGEKRGIRREAAAVSYPDSNSGGREEVTEQHRPPRIFDEAPFGDDPDGLPRSQRLWLASEPRVDRVVDGVSDWMDRVRGLGNAVVPQVVEWIGRRIVQDAQVHETVSQMKSNPPSTPSPQKDSAA